MIKQFSFSDVISVTSLAISFIVLLVNLKNRKTQLRLYSLTRQVSRSSGIALEKVAAEKTADGIVVKLAVFNPGSVAVLIRTVEVYRKEEHWFFLARLVGGTYWKRLYEIRWWPTENPSCTKIKSFHEEYRNMLVKDVRDILVSMDGELDGNVYRFVLKTNHGQTSLMTSLSGGTSTFAINFEQWYAED